MKIRRYLDGRAVTGRELAALSLVTPALTEAVRTARRRAAGEASETERRPRETDGPSGSYEG